MPVKADIWKSKKQTNKQNKKKTKLREVHGFPDMAM